MSSKVILFQCLSLAFALMIASEVAAARGLAETSVGTTKEVKSTEGVEAAKYEGGGNGGYRSGENEEHPIGYGPPCVPYC